ncbi:MAG: carboxypeptidase-like regulatory domain-containing protein, partial [Spirochaetaceae bacterium]|nr:carboxypeptidase-like regulatory domain-containing protein [Spirochaetaceae bacterium]
HTVTLASGIPNDVTFSRTTASVTITSAGQQVRADFPGEYLRTSSIRGRVLAVTQGSQPEPVEGIALGMTGLQHAADTTDANGRYEFVALRPGEYTVSLLTTAGFAFDATSFTRTLTTGQNLEHDFVGAADLFIATESLDVGRVAIPYSQQLVARGGTTEGLVWSLEGGARLPEGLAFTSNGLVAGTPRSVGFTEFRVSVTNAQGRRASAALSLRVCEGALGLDVGDYQVFREGERGECGFFVRAPQAGGAPRQEATSIGGPWLDKLLERERAYARSHARLRASEAALMERLSAEGPLQILPDLSQQVAQATGGGAGRGRAPEELAIRLSDAFAGSCTVDTTVTARLVAENEHLAFYEYQTTSSPDNVRQILDYYADYGEEVIQRYFGGVSDVNGDGIVNVLIRPDLPGTTLAYVWSADMTLSRNSCPASNEMELIHFDAESIEAISGNDFWALGTIVHEMKHVSSLYKGYRRRSASRFHPFWIEEGTADIAKEVSSRLAWQRAGGPRMTDRVTGDDLRDAFRSTGGNARAEAYGTFTALARTVWAISPDSSALSFQYGDGEVGDVYGSGWHFHRFLRDWVVGGGSSAADARFMRVLNDSLTTAGVAGLAAVTGRPMAELLIEHAVAMTFAGSESVAGADVPHFTTYDFPTATEVFSSPDPPGFYPWPVTTVGEDTGDDFAPVAVPLATSGTRTFDGRLAASGVRIHDFRARGPGNGAAFYFDIPPSARVIVARIVEPNP